MKLFFLYPSFLAASLTRFFVSFLILSEPFNAIETVNFETPAYSAMSFIVVRFCALFIFVLQYVADITVI